MTPSQYPDQRFLYSQRNSQWAGKELDHSGCPMGHFGCTVASAAYILSRFYNKEISPGAWCDWLNQNKGFTSSGLMYWGKVDEYTKGALKYAGKGVLGLWKRASARYTLINVIFGRYSHWVVNLRGGLVMDPWTGTIETYPNKKYSREIQRVYFK